MSFKITKAQIDAYINNGFTVAKMAEDLTSQSGVKCSAAVVRRAAKTYGINLRNKIMPSHFVLEDLDEVATNPVSNAASTVPVQTVAEEPTVQL